LLSIRLFGGASTFPELVTPNIFFCAGDLYDLPLPTMPGTNTISQISDVVEYLPGERVDAANLVRTRSAAENLVRMVAFTF
jgi:hypothetical protein